MSEANTVIVDTPMGGENSPRRSDKPLSDSAYGRVAVGLHWLTVPIVVMVGALGLLRNTWPNEASQNFWINIHAVSGLTLWLIVVFRLAWRLTHRPPALPDYLRRMDRVAAALVHGALYGLLIVTPLIGIVTFFYHGRALNLGIFDIDLGLSKNRAIFHPTQELHGYLAYGIFALVGIHVAATVWHGLKRNDGILTRMIHWSRST